MIKRPANLYSTYHAHIYFNAASLDQARNLCENAGETLKISVGRVHTRPVGPHPHWSCQLSFDAPRFDEVITWLDQHRHGLNILVHGVTGDDLADHTEHAAWLGQASELNLALFK
jgi:aromatic ring-cleaving dioxygenase